MVPEILYALTHLDHHHLAESVVLQDVSTVLLSVHQLEVLVLLRKVAPAAAAAPPTAPTALAPVLLLPFPKEKKDLWRHHAAHKATVAC